MEKEEKDIILKNTTSLNESDITSFQLFAQKKHTFIVATIITLVLVGLGVGLCFVNAYVGGAIIIAGIVGGIIFFPYLSKEQIKRQNAVLFNGGKYVNVFEFYDDHLKVTNVDEDRDEDYFQTFEYSTLYQFVEYQEFLFIYTSKNQCFLVLKTGMNKGTIAELIEFLKNKNIKYVDKKSLGEMKKNKK